MKKGKVLIVDDEEYQRDILRAILKSEGYFAECAENGARAIEIFDNFLPEVVLCDLKLPDMDGIKVMDALREKYKQRFELIIFTAHGSIESAVEAIKKGAFEYITKPVDRDKLLITTQRALERGELIRENIQLKKQLTQTFSIEGIIGKHPSMEKVFKFIRLVAPLDITVLITGETGTGKELVARAIHSLSTRKNNVFQPINCASVPEALIESELFGYEKGAFTGAFAKKPGLIEISNGGTLFFDEIGEIPPGPQAKLLRFLEEKKIRHLGGKDELPVNVRLIVATNRKLSEEIKRGQFREDLFYRLSGFTIELPPLRERASDIFLLANYFIEKYNVLFSKTIRGISSEVMRKLMLYHWPGNVRQLDSVIEKAILIANGEIIEIEDIEIPEATHSEADNNEIPLDGFSLEELEKQIIVKTMEKAGGRISQAAKLLGTTYRTMEYRVKKYGISKVNQPNGELDEQNR